MSEADDELVKAAYDLLYKTAVDVVVALAALEKIAALSEGDPELAEIHEEALTGIESAKFEDLGEFLFSSEEENDT